MSHAATVLLSLRLDVRDEQWGGRGRIAGTVEIYAMPANLLVSRRVRLCRQRDGRVIREAWSAPGTGAFSFDWIDERELYYVAAFDHTGSFVGVLEDRIQPALI